ncbi:MAG TPA: lamin tail domain-containing protein, partial [Chthoniobacteraceae bacterium]|nr:lamin tail domain-containing protein [Chthoniobacteraceae bacterium]
TVSPDPPGGFPRLYSWPDQTTTGATTSVIRIENNFIDDRILDTALGVNHPGGIFAPAWGFGNVTGNPLFVDKATRNFALQTGSPARGTAAGGLDYGATVAEWAYILGGPTSTTASTSASFTIGGPGMVTYKWRLDGGVWSAPIQIGAGGVMPRTGAIVRQATLNLTSLAAGSHTLEVLGQDMAGNWQDADPARTVIGATQAAPTARTWTIDTANPIIRINEVLADSATLPDTVELTNLGANSMSLAGWTLTDDPAVPAKVSLNAITIPAGGYATVTALSLDRNGDTVYLYQGATLRDSIAFGNQIADLTIGRVGASGAWTLCTPTLGAANVAARLGDQTVVRLNEWFTSGDVLYDDDWIELVNPSALPIDLGGLHITDNRSGDPLAHTFGPLTFIAANGFARFLADGNPEDGPSHLSFSLDAQQESIALLDASGATIDVVFYYPQTTDRSMGRDAGGNLVFYELPTRGFLNGTSDPAYANALALLRGLRITEIMFNAVGGSDFDYVELRNVGATPLALGGVHFVQGIDFTFPAMTLNAGQNVLVVKHLAKFRSRYGNAPIVAGVYSGQLDNGGETLGLQLPPPFDANVLTFRYEDTWYLSTDGGGTSLVVPNPLVNANIWGDKDTWVASGIGGNPDGASPTSLTFSGWSALHGVNSVSDDGDKDGAAALIEFELGMSNENPNGANGQAGLPAIGRAPDGRATLSFLVPENAAAVQNHGFADVIYNVQAASAVGGWTTVATKSFGASWSGAGTATVGGASGGFVPVTITDTAAPGTPQRFLRLQAVWVP